MRDKSLTAEGEIAKLEHEYARKHGFPQTAEEYHGYFLTFRPALRAGVGTDSLADWYEYRRRRDEILIGAAQ